jgi:hypothetical protein
MDDNADTESDPIRELYRAVNSHVDVINANRDLHESHAALLDILVTTVEEITETIGADELTARFRSAVRELIRPEVKAAVAEVLAERKDTSDGATAD